MSGAREQQAGPGGGPPRGSGARAPNPSGISLTPAARPGTVRAPGLGAPGERQRRRIDGPANQHALPFYPTDVGPRRAPGSHRPPAGAWGPAAGCACGLCGRAPLGPMPRDLACSRTLTRGAARFRTRPRRPLTRPAPERCDAEQSNNRSNPGPRRSRYRVRRSSGAGPRRWPGRGCAAPQAERRRHGRPRR